MHLDSCDISLIGIVNVLPLAGNTLLKSWNCKAGRDMKVSLPPSNPLPFFVSIILPVVCKHAEMAG